MEASSARPPPFLLRDKIRLFDRFALHSSPLNTSRSVRDDQAKTDVVMFPGWKHVPNPPAMPLVLPRRSKHDPIAALAISTDPNISPRIVLKDTDLEPIEDTIKRIMDDAIAANTHALTARFQAVLKQQSGSIEHKHQVLTEKYRQRVTKAMLAAQAKLDRCRTELAETKRAVQAGSKIAAEREKLLSENNDLKTELETLSAKMKQEKATMNTKVKFLRALIADHARVKSESRHSTSQQEPAPVGDELRPWTENSNAPPAKQTECGDKTKPQQNQEEAGKPPSGKQPSGQEMKTHLGEQAHDRDADEHEEADSSVTRLVEELETKQEQITKLSKEKKTSEQKIKALTDENAKMKTDLDQQRLVAESVRQQLSEKLAHANGQVRDRTMELHGARTAIEQLHERDLEMAASLSLMEENFRGVCHEKDALASESRTTIESLGSELKRRRRALCVRSLLFQAHLKSLESSVVVCDRIDEYLDAQLTCKQCLGLLRKPQVLYPCGHSFCEPCVETLRDADSKRLVCCDCDGVCEAVTVTNAALDAIISQYNWWKVSLDDLRKKYAGAQVSLAGENNGDWEFAVAVSSSANETNPVLRPSLAALNRQFSKLK